MSVLQNLYISKNVFIFYFVFREGMKKVSLLFVASKIIRVGWTPKDKIITHHFVHISFYTLNIAAFVP